MTNETPTIVFIASILFIILLENIKLISISILIMFVVVVLILFASDFNA